jgi:hypothetical protein
MSNDGRAVEESRGSYPLGMVYDLSGEAECNPGERLRVGSRRWRRRGWRADLAAMLARGENGGR